jgi:hypothetical protein
MAALDFPIIPPVMKLFSIVTERNSYFGPAALHFTIFDFVLRALLAELL